MNIREELDFGGVPTSGYIDEPDICPLCKRAIKPVRIHKCAYMNGVGGYSLVVVSLCKACNDVFISLYNIQVSGLNFSSCLKYSEPNRFTPKEFDARIKSISPNFEKIYNQSLAAEMSSLSEIAGMGYRKALEFLIKDYLIRKSPKEEAQIKAMELGNCIGNKVTAENLKAVASRSAWIGNDFAHYTRRFEDRDITDLKAFIDATVYWISMELITEEALSISRKDR